MTKHVVSFSGGKDSTAMLLRMIELDMQIDEIVFLDTTKEFPGMYAHINKIEKYIERDVTKIILPFDYYFYDHKAKKGRGKHANENGYSWCDFTVRWCSGLKGDNMKQYLQKYKKEKVITYLGIAYDELPRTKKNKDERIFAYPLIDWKFTEEKSLQYCYSKGFDWGGLYKYFKRVSCWCCSFSNLQELRNLRTHFPDLWQQLKEMDNKTWRQFRQNYSVIDLDRRFELEDKQPKLFKEKIS